MKRFPLGLTLAAAAALAILCGLGAWQLQRLAWKQDLLARIAALHGAPARPIGPVLAAAKAEDWAWTRVAVRCRPGPAGRDGVRNVVREGQIVWRAVSLCRLADGPFDAILVDRGIVDGSQGAVQPPRIDLPPPALIEGVLAPAGAISNAPIAADAPLVLMVERETPPAPGLTPSALPPEMSNRHLEYALTWFGLAAVLAAVYAALLRRRLKAP
ncbi:MAG: SURF1 family protein [Pseudomonadota bacterium]